MFYKHAPKSTKKAIWRMLGRFAKLAIWKTLAGPVSIIDGIK